MLLYAFRSLLSIGSLIGVLMMAITPAAAGLIRDTEIEQLLRDYAAPILQAANLEPQQIDVIVLNDAKINAFVLDSRRIFINSGLLISANTPNQIIGVIAHETGHITGGHLAGLRNALKKTSTAQFLITLAGIAAIAGSAASGNLTTSDSASIGSAIFSAGNTVSLRTLLAYRRSQEAAADQTALRLLNASEQSGQGMLAFFQRLHNDSLGSLDGIDPYYLTHPTGGERLATLQNRAEEAPWFNQHDAPDLQFRHDMVRAKLRAFLEPPKQTLRRIGTPTTQPELYGYTIALYRAGRFDDALSHIDALIAEQPKNPYFHELKGQIYFETGRPKDALPALTDAVALSPNAPLLRLLLARAMLAINTTQAAETALEHLIKAVRLTKDDPFLYHTLALAYGQLDRIGEAELASAERFFLLDKPRYALRHARRARDLLQGREQLRADDIIALVEETP